VFTIRSPEPNEWPVALRLTLPLAVGAGEPLIERMACDVPPPIAAGMRVAEHRGELVAAGCILLEAGPIVTVWPPLAAPIGEPAIAWEARRALSKCLEALARAEGRVTLQVTLPERPDGATHADIAKQLSDAGFKPAGALDYLVWTSQPVVFDPLPPGWHCRTVPSDDPDLLAVIEESYVATQDCPMLNGVVPAGAAVQGYRAASAYRPDWWWLWRRGDDPVGCLILADHPDDLQAELVYMGLVPRARGFGGGAAMTRFAQRITREAGRRRLVLAVDAANERAQDVYLLAGFQRWERRRLWLRFLGRGP